MKVVLKLAACVATGVAMFLVSYTVVAPGIQIWQPLLAGFLVTTAFDLQEASFKR